VKKRKPEWIDGVTGVVAGVETVDEGTRRYEVSRTGESPSLSVPLSPEVEVLIELPRTPEILVYAGREVPQLGAPYLLVQPEIVANDWRQGWVPMGGEWPTELYLREQETLSIGELDGDPVIWINHNQLEVEQTGTFQMYVVLRRQSA
jgi:hypothetical protein